MVDPIGIRSGTVADRRLSPIGAATPAAPVRTTVTSEHDAADPAALTLISRAMAAEAPVDGERVSRIKKAIEEGRFPLVPSTIADRLLAARFEWMSHDAS